MSSQHAFGALFEVEQRPQITNPEHTLSKDSQGIYRNPNDVELREMQQGQTTAGPSRSCHQSDVESSHAVTHENEPSEVVQSIPRLPMDKWRLLSACFMYFANGLNDSAPGALIPHLESDYDIGYAVVSLIFVTNALGFISAAPLTHVLETRFGRSKVYAFSLSCIAVADIAIICTPPFPVVVVCFFLIGFGIALSLALSNVFCANLANSTAALGAAHGSYGIGGTIGPLVATAIASHGVRWSFFYFLTLGVTLWNILFSAWSFRGYEKDLPEQYLEQINSRHSNPSQASKKSKLLKQAMKSNVTMLGALFIFAYQGAEVSISGWVVSFLVAYRGGDLSHVGYVSAGFWAGITLGRFLLSHPAAKLGNKLSVFLLVAGSIAFQLITWLLPNVIGDAVAVSLVGLLLGPIYPCAVAVFTTLLPRKIQVSSLGFVSAMGSSGGAVWPLCTGLLASKVGTVVLHPICIGLYATMVGSWVLLPKIGKRRE